MRGKNQAFDTPPPPRLPLVTTFKFKKSQIFNNELNGLSSPQIFAS